MCLDRPKHKRGCLSQAVRIKGGRWYRLFLQVRSPAGDDARLTVVVEPFDAAGPKPQRIGRWTIQPTNEWGWWDGHFELAKQDLGIRVSVLTDSAGGPIWLAQVRLIHIEYEEISGHWLANPPLPFAYPPPRLCQRLAIASDDRQRGERLLGLLAKRWPSAELHRVALNDPGSSCDALLLDVNRPEAMRLGWSECLQLAGKGVVILSWPALQGALQRSPWRGQIICRTIKDPELTLGRVEWANFITRGFALHDTLGLSWTSPGGRSCLRYAQRSRDLRTLCWRYKLQVVLSTETPFEWTDRHPVMLARHQPDEKGTLVVMDFDGLLEGGPNRARAGLWLYLLANALGADQCGLGQYVTPLFDRARFEKEVRELVVRYPGPRLIEPAGKDDYPQIEAGQPQAQFGLPAATKPAAVIRTGRSSDDWPIVYGLLLWLKRLAQQIHRDSPYARALLSSRRVVAVPLVCPHRWGRFDLTDPPDPFPPVETQVSGPIDAVLDLSTADSTQDAILLGPEVTAVARSLQDRLRGANRRTGPDTRGHLQLALPGALDRTGADSIQPTDRAATLIEQFVALRSGWTAMNRHARPQRLRLSLPIAGAAELTIFDRMGQASRAGTLTPRNGHIDLVLEPGWGLTVAGQGT